MKEIVSAIARDFDVVVVEGCDGSGKSTICRDLANLGFFYVHSGRSPEGVELFPHYDLILKRSGRLVLDRSFISELVYGPLFHGSSRITQADAEILAAKISVRPGIVVHANAPTVEIYKRIQRRGEDSWTLEEILQINAAYDAVLKKLARFVRVQAINTLGAASTGTFE